MNYKLLALIGLVIVLISGCSEELDYYIDGDRVYVDDENVYISVTPHTISHSDWVYAEFESKTYSGDVDIAFGFNTESIRPKHIQYYNPHEEDIEKSYICEHEFNYTLDPNFFTCYNEENSTLIFEHSFLTGNLPAQTAYWNETINIDWVDFASSWESANVDFDGKNKWWFKQGQHINAEQNYKIRYYLEKTSSSYGKYDIAIKPSGETIQEAIANEHFYFLDPWYLGGGINYDDDLWAYYNFDAYDGDFIRDNATAGNNIDLEQAGTVALRAGYMNTAAYFEGYTGGTGEYLNISELGQVTFDELTVCSWWEIEAEVYDSGQGIMTDGTGSSSQMGYNHPGSGDVDKRGNARWGLTTTGGGATVYGNATGTKLYSGLYHYVCFVYDGTEARIYVNGTLASEVAGNYPVTGNVVMNRLEFGKDIGLPGGDDHEFSGEIDEVGIWNRSYSQAEINVLYDNYVAGYGYLGGGTGLVDGLQFTPSPFYYNNTVNCSFIGNIGGTFNATINWTNASVLVESNIYENQPDRAVISDNYTFTTGDGFVVGDDIDCLVSVYNETDIGFDSVSGLVSNYAPTVPTPLSPDDNYTINVNYTTISCSGGTDPEGETTLNYTFYNSSDALLQNSLLTTHVFSNLTVGYNPWYCKAMDSYGGESAATTSRNVTYLNLSVCGGPNSYFINFTFVDEETAGYVNGSQNIVINDWYSSAYTSNVFDYNYLNATEAPSSGICVYPDDIEIVTPIKFIYGGADYETRTYESDFTLTNATTTQILYQLASSTGGNYVFYTVDASLNPITNVDIIVQRSIGGVTTLILTGTTDDSGAVTFWLLPDISHTLTFTKSGYPTTAITIVPGATAERTVVMGEGSAEEIESEYFDTAEGFNWNITPAGGILTFGTSYDFKINLTDSKEGLLACRMILENSTDYVYEEDGCTVTPEGDILQSLNRNMTHKQLTGHFYYKTNLSTPYIVLATNYWVTLNQSGESGGTIKAFFEQSQLLFSIDGTNEEKASGIIWFFLFLTIGVGIISMVSGLDLRNPFAIMVFVTIPITFGCAVNLLPLVSVGDNVFSQFGLAVIAWMVNVGHWLRALGRGGV